MTTVLQRRVIELACRQLAARVRTQFVGCEMFAHWNARTGRIDTGVLKMSPRHHRAEVLAFTQGYAIGVEDAVRALTPIEGVDVPMAAKARADGRPVEVPSETRRARGKAALAGLRDLFVGGKRP